MRVAGKEEFCSRAFIELGECWHVWTPENHTIIFADSEDYKVGMTILGICAYLFPAIKILTFELMSNHIHLVVSGDQQTCIKFFETFKSLIRKHLRCAGRPHFLEGFIGKMRKIETLEDLRNCISYVNRNGFLVSTEYGPHTYPWGSNKYFFNPVAKELATLRMRTLTTREKRAAAHSHIADDIKKLKGFDGEACPLDFCHIEEGEAIFHDARQYFFKVTRNLEAMKEIAMEISESIFYTDDELYSLVYSISKGQYGVSSPTLLSKDAKIDVARMMHYDYNASNKQIMRMLKLEVDVVNKMFPQQTLPR